MAQFVVTQAAINIATGERYKHVIDELIMFAQGVYGEDSGYSVMEQNLKDRLLSTHRAAELTSRQKPNVTLQDLRASLGGTAVSDEEFLLRATMPAEEVNAMVAAGPAKRHYNPDIQPMLKLLRGLQKSPAPSNIIIEKPDFRLELRQ